MLLAIDAGNTNVVFALVDLGAGTRFIRARWRIATDPRRTGDEYAVWINQLLSLEGLGMNDVDAVIISTVVPRALHNLEVLSQKYFKVEPLIAGQPPVEWHINVDVPMPQNARRRSRGQCHCRPFGVRRRSHRRRLRHRDDLRPYRLFGCL